MRKAIFFMHAGMCDEYALWKMFGGLDQERWVIVDIWSDMYGVYDDHAKAEPGINKLYQKFSNSISGLIDVGGAFIKNFSQQAAIKFKSDLRLVHLVRDPLETATLWMRDNSYPDHDDDNAHIRVGRHIKRDMEWTPFQQCLWEWVDCHITAMLLTEQVGVGNVFMLPHHTMNLETMQGFLDWVDDSAKLAGIVGNPQRVDVAQQDRVESFTWFNGLPEREQRMVKMLFKKLMAAQALSYPPEFIAAHL